MSYQNLFRRSTSKRKSKFKSMKYKKKKKKIGITTYCYFLSKPYLKISLLKDGLERILIFQNKFDILVVYSNYQNSVNFSYLFQVTILLYFLEFLHGNIFSTHDLGINFSKSVELHLGQWQTSQQLLLYKKLSFPFRISSVSVTKSAGNCGFGHIC